MWSIDAALNRLLTDTAYRVEKSNWILHDAVPTASPLTISAAPTVSFRCRVKVSTSAGHTDCSGTITIGTETLTFSAAGTKTTTVLLSAKPTVTYSGLDCHILIEAITASGADIIQETQIAIDCRFNNTQKMFQNSFGEWDTSQAIAYINDSSMDIGDTFSHGNYDYQISQLTSHNDLDNSEQFRKLWLTGKTPAPSGRTTVIPVADVETTEFMTKAVYDVDEDGIADKAEGVRDLDDLPATPAEGEVVAKDGKLYVAVTSS